MESLKNKKTGYVSKSLYNSKCIVEIYERKENNQDTFLYFGAVPASDYEDYACFLVHHNGKDEEFLTYEKAKKFFDLLN
jgi:hypothetical protein